MKAVEEIRMCDFNPLVSIVIPVYNGVNYVREAIDSALAQNYPNCEILVINDGSTDTTEEIARSYGNKIRYFSKPNGGVATALNLGIQEMSGEYFSWLSHDDLYLPNKIFSQIKLLSTKEQKETIIAGGWQTIDQFGNVLEVHLPTKKFKTEQLSTPLFPLFKGAITGIPLLIHKSHFGRVGTFDERLLCAQDFDLWFRMMRGQSVAFVDEIIASVRLHLEQGSNTMEGIAAERSEVRTYLFNMLSDEEKIAIGGTLKNFCIDEYVSVNVEDKELKKLIKSHAKRYMLPVIGGLQLELLRFCGRMGGRMRAMKTRGGVETIKKIIKMCRQSYK